MRLASLSVMVPEGRETSDNQVILKHDTQFTLKIGNHCQRTADALVKIDGKEIGAFRVYAGQYLRLERTPGDTGKFTFYKKDSEEAALSGAANIASFDHGLIQVTLKPEKKREVLSRDIVQHVNTYDKGMSLNSSRPRAMNMSEGEVKTSGGIAGGVERLAKRSRAAGGGSGQNSGLSAGMTGLSGHSDQKFQDVGPLEYAPEDEWVTINLRLVAESGPHELRAIGGISNRIPDPVS